jgi:hypothetical protein
VSSNGPCSVVRRYHAASVLVGCVGATGANDKLRCEQILKQVGPRLRKKLGSLVGMSDVGIWQEKSLLNLGVCPLVYLNIVFEIGLLIGLIVRLSGREGASCS